MDIVAIKMWESSVEWRWKINYKSSNWYWRKRNGYDIVEIK